MTDAMSYALIVSAGPTLMALIGVVAIWKSHTTNSKKLDHITVLTNSTLSAANKRIEELEMVVARLLKDKKELRKKTK